MDRPGTGKFRPVLEKKARISRREKVRQKKLQKKYGIPDANVLIVEKRGMIKSGIRMGAVVFRGIFRCGAVFLIFIGITALVYPEPRSELLLIWNEVLNQLGCWLP